MTVMIKLQRLYTVSILGTNYSEALKWREKMPYFTIDTIECFKQIFTYHNFVSYILFMAVDS